MLYGEFKPSYRRNFKLKRPGLEAKLHEISKQGLGWIQLYIEPGTTKQNISKLRHYGFQYVVHAAHEDHGFAPFLQTKGINRQLIDEATSAAQYLDSKFIVFHPGQLTSEEWDGNLGILLELEGNFDETIRYISRKVAKGTIPLAENMPNWANRKHQSFENISSPFYSFMLESGFGFCLDLVNVAVNQNCFNHRICNPPSYDIEVPMDHSELLLFCGLGADKHSERKLHEMAQSHYRKTKDFLSLHPLVFHLRGVDYWNVRRPKSSQPLPMGHLNAVQLSVAIPYALKHKSPLIVESLDPSIQRGDIDFINAQYFHFERSQ